MGQFEEGVLPDDVIQALMDVGFDQVYEVAVGAEAVTLALRSALQAGGFKKPLISSACPAIIRLIQIRFPDLLDHIVRIETPMDAAARLARKEAAARTGLEPAAIGVFFVSPCPAKATAVKEPLGNRQSCVDGVIGISTLYGEVSKKITGANNGQVLRRATALGMQWGYAGGENHAIDSGVRMAVDGIHSAISVLDGIEQGELKGIDYIECQACVGGCMGGALTVQNPFVGRARLEAILGKMQPADESESSIEPDTFAELMRQGFFELPAPIEPRPVMRLDDDVARAISKMTRLEDLVEELPGFDCGSCGSPTCRALAEDIVQGFASRTDCFFKLREKVSALAEQMVEIARTIPPIMSNKEGSVVPDSLTLRYVVEALNLGVVTGKSLLDSRLISGAYSSDLLSDVMANASEGSIWVTIQTHQNIVAVALVSSLNGVIITGGRQPDATTIARAREENIAILTSDASSFDVTGRLYAMLSRR